MNSTKLLIILSMLAICQKITANLPYERTLYFQNQNKVLSDFREFNLTSKETEIYHAIDRIDLTRIFHTTKIRNDITNKKLQKEKISLILDSYNEEKSRIYKFWNEFYSNPTLHGSLYFVSFSNENGTDFTGYYLIRDGRIIKKSLISW